MSTDLNVFLNRTQMPTTDDWASAVSAAGYGVQLPADFDSNKHTGYLPCKFRGIDTGFEYYASELSTDVVDDNEIEPEHLYALTNNNFIVSFVIRHSTPVGGDNQLDYDTAHLIAACLTKLSNGTFHDPQCGVFLTGDAALDEAKLLFNDRKNNDGSDFDAAEFSKQHAYEKHSIAAYTASTMQELNLEKSSPLKRLWSKLTNNSK